MNVGVDLGRRVVGYVADDRLVGWREWDSQPNVQVNLSFHGCTMYISKFRPWHLSFSPMIFHTSPALWGCLVAESPMCVTEGLTMSKRDFKISLAGFKCANTYGKQVTSRKVFIRLHVARGLQTKMRGAWGKTKHTAAGIPTWSPTVVLICRSTAYVWQSGRDAQFSADCGRMCLILFSRCITSTKTRHFGLSLGFVVTKFATEAIGIWRLFWAPITFLPVSRGPYCILAAILWTRKGRSDD
jgi:hypothetical protein